MGGLLNRDIAYIEQAIKHFEEIDKVILFGSRAMGNYKKGSDVDLAIQGKNVNYHIILRLSDYLNEVYPIPYFFDIINYNQLSNEELKKHIDQEGKVIFEKIEV